MRIDTEHGTGQCIVKIVPTTDQERALSDEDIKRVAFNQHYLLWHNGSDGTAVLPRRIRGVMPPDTTTVKREADHIFVTIPFEL